MTLEEHLKRTDGEGELVHRFLDQYHRKYGIDHRVVLHHRTGIEVVAKFFGEEAIHIAVQHIMDDFWGDVPRDFDDRNFFRFAWSLDSLRFAEAVGHAINWKRIAMEGR